MIKERIAKLVETYKEDSEVVEIINDTLNSFAEYVRVVVEMENAISILRFRLEPMDYRERVELLDRNRRIAHNSVIAGVKMLNRLSLAESLPPFFEGDMTDRFAIGDFAGRVTSEIFGERQK